MKNQKTLNHAGEVYAREEYAEQKNAGLELRSKQCSKSGKFAFPALRLGRWVGVLALLVCVNWNLQAQNTQRVWTGGSNGALKTSGNWSPNTGNISVSTDSVFNSNSNNAALTATTGTVGSLNANGTSSFKIHNNTSASTDSTLTLGGAGNLGNSFSGVSTDLIYVSTGADLTIQGPTAGAAFLKVALGQNGTFNIAGTSTISSVISGTNLGFTKTGAGTLTLNGTNTYTGSTIVSAGKIVLGSAGSIASDSILKIASGATFDVKAKSGTGFNLNNPLTIDVDAANAGKLDATGAALTYGGNLTLNITTSTPLTSYNLFTFSSETGTFSSIALTGSFSGNMTNTSGVWTSLSNEYDFTFNESTGVLATAAVPEPGTWVLLGIAAAFVLYRLGRKESVTSRRA